MNLAPGPRRISELLSFLKLRKNNPIRLYENIFNKYGDIVYFKAAGQKTLMLNDPEAIKQVLQTEAKHCTKSIGYQRFKLIIGNGLLASEGEVWIKQRRLLAWAFSSKHIEKIQPLMSEQSLEMIKRWKGQKEVDLAEEMNFVTLQIISVSLFGKSQIESGKIIRDSLKEMISYLQTTRHIFIQLLLLPLPIKNKKALALKIEKSLPFKSTKRFIKAIETIDKIVLEMIEERKKKNENTNFLDTLINARDDVDQTQMNDQQLRDETVNMLIAGHETTANALTWTWHQVLKNPAVYQKLKDEVDRVVKGQTPTMSELNELVYAKACVEEAMRLFPPFWRISRSNTIPLKIKGFDIPSGTSIITSMYTVQRRNDLWKDAKTFKPERFLEEKKDITPFSFLPFGAGPRVCIGSNFAFVEALSIIATMVKHYDFEPKFNPEPDYIVSLTLQPKDGCLVGIKERK